MLRAKGSAGTDMKKRFNHFHAGGNLHSRKMAIFMPIKPITVAAAGGISGHIRSLVGGGWYVSAKI